MSNKILVLYLAFHYCHSCLAGLVDATACDCITLGENIGEEFVDLLRAHMADIKAPGAIAD